MLPWLTQGRRVIGVELQGHGHTPDTGRPMSIERFADDVAELVDRVADLGLAAAWITGGGYKYLQLGEGNAFLRIPPSAVGVRPVITGWFAEFEYLFDAARPDIVAYGPPATRFAGGTYDPSSHYRAARVLDFFAANSLEPPFLEEVSQHQVGVLRSGFDALDLPADLLSRDRAFPPESIGGFLALRSPVARRIQRVLAGRGVATDSRGDILRLGPAPYLSDRQLEDAVAALCEVVTELGKSDRRSR